MPNRTRAASALSGGARPGEGTHAPQKALPEEGAPTKDVRPPRPGPAKSGAIISPIAGLPRPRKGRLSEDAKAARSELSGFVLADHSQGLGPMLLIRARRRVALALWPRSGGSPTKLGRSGHAGASWGVRVETVSVHSRLGSQLCRRPGRLAVSSMRKHGDLLAA